MEKKPKIREVREVRGQDFVGKIRECRCQELVLWGSKRGKLRVHRTTVPHLLLCVDWRLTSGVVQQHLWRAFQPQRVAQPRSAAQVLLAFEWWWACWIISVKMVGRRKLEHCLQRKATQCLHFGSIFESGRFLKLWPWDFTRWSRWSDLGMLFDSVEINFFWARVSSNCRFEQRQGKCQGEVRHLQYLERWRNMPTFYERTLHASSYFSHQQEALDSKMPGWHEVPGWETSQAPMRLSRLD